MRYLLTTDENLTPDAVAQMRAQFGEWLAKPDADAAFLGRGVALHDLETGRTYGGPQRPLIVTADYSRAAAFAGALGGALLTVGLLLIAGLIP